FLEHVWQERLRHFKADALEKDQRVLDAEKKLEQLARSLGAEGVVAENRELSRQNADMKRQVGEAKRDLANYLSEAANIVYENDLLRSIANVKPEQLKLKDFKLKDKVTSAKAVAAAKQMEKEVAELEAERGKLKARLRQLSELAAEKVSLLHNLQPEQMLQLEEIAARMRKGKLELPLDDQSRQLKEERDELSKRLAAKDREVAEHVDRKVEEVLKKQGATKDLEAKVAALEKDNEMLQSSLEAYKAGYAELVMQQESPRLRLVRLAAEAWTRSIPDANEAFCHGPIGPTARPGPAEDARDAADGVVISAAGEVCSLYCQVVEALEELSRERSLREGLAEEVSSFQQRFDRLLAEQEVLYKDYFAQREEWLATTRSLEERLRLQGDLLTDCQQKCEISEGQMRTWQRLAEGTAPELQEELVSAMGRIAALEQNESVLSRKVEAERQGHSIVKEAFDNLQKDCCEREGFLKERLSKAVLWKRRGANALRIARRKIQSMVASSDYERVQQQLQVCRQREFDLSRRQTELTLKVAQQEDKLREMMDLQDRCRSLDHLVRETEQEFTVLRRRLQLREPRFAAEVALFTRLTAELQRTLGFVGSFEAAARALGLAEARVAGLGFEAGAAISVEASLDEKLRKFDVNNDGFITLGDLRKFFESH
ncbi:CEP290, partial [Symbiodinium sp. CCMP2456]